MKLYHFTSNHHIDGIRRNGITKGHFLFKGTNGKSWLEPNHQWLTDNPDFCQSWATQNLIKEDRTEYRIEVHIPKSQWGNLYSYEDLKGFNPELAEVGGSEHWYIFEGRIKSSWLRQIKCKAS